MSEKKSGEKDAQSFTDEEIRAKAYEIWKARSVEDPSPYDDWGDAIEALKKEKQPWICTGWNEKKPWDCLQLFLVPLALAALGFCFQELSKQNEKSAADDKAKQETLTKYLDQMSDLLQKGLRKSKQDSKNKQDPETFIIAQAKTAVTLQSLDPVRQHLVIQFLESAKLNGLNKNKGLLFNARMSEAQLHRAGLSFASMIRTDLNKANLREADLKGARLIETQLIKADLTEANLRGAILVKTNLFAADLRGADLHHALLLHTDLTKAKLDKKQLEQGKDSPLLCKVKLPEEVKSAGIISDRDCDVMKKTLPEDYPDTFKTSADVEKYIKDPKLQNLIDNSLTTAE